MEKMLKFKTNINCNGCLSSLKPVLDQAEGICHWEVDLYDENKILTVKSTGITGEEVIRKIKQMGFIAFEIS